MNYIIILVIGAAAAIAFSIFLRWIDNKLNTKQNNDSSNNEKQNDKNQK